MAQNWAKIASQVAAALTDVGFSVTLRRAGSGGPTSPHDVTPLPPPVDYQVSVVQDSKQMRDAGGTMIGVARETLLVSAVGVVPQKADRVLLDRWREIESVDTLAPAGVAVLYTLTLVA